ncbi:hypothetical protein LCGC14_1608240, partial [marine sediment metagenome]
MTENFYKRWERKNSDKAKLNARYDTDKMIWFLEPYVMRDAKGSKVPGVVNVTG